jgi:DNA-binding FadR family transcriptional regulator
VDQFQVAQTSVREALRILESEGLVSVRRGSPGGGQVREADPRTLARYSSLLLQFEGATVEDVHQARIMIEPLVARRLAEHPDRTTLADALAHALGDEDASQGQPRQLARMEGWFHQLVTRLAGNETLALLSAVSNLIVAHHVNQVLAENRRSNGRTRSGFTTAHRAHGRLVKLVAAGDADGVEQLWRRHLEEALTNLGAAGQTTVADLMG